MRREEAHRGGRGTWTLVLARVHRTTCEPDDGVAVDEFKPPSTSELKKEFSDDPSAVFYKYVDSVLTPVSALHKHTALYALREPVEVGSPRGARSPTVSNSAVGRRRRCTPWRRCRRSLECSGVQDVPATLGGAECGVPKGDASSHAAYRMEDCSGLEVLHLRGHADALVPGCEDAFASDARVCDEQLHALVDPAQQAALEKSKSVAPTFRRAESPRLKINWLLLKHLRAMVRLFVGEPEKVRTSDLFAIQTAVTASSFSFQRTYADGGHTLLEVSLRLLAQPRVSTPIKPSKHCAPWLRQALGLFKVAAPEAAQDTALAPTKTAKTAKKENVAKKQKAATETRSLRRRYRRRRRKP